MWGGPPGTLPATAALALLTAGGVVAAVTAARTARATRAFRRALRSRRVTVPDALRHAAEETRLAGKVTTVADQRPYALTHGLLHPRVVVSTGLAALLTPPEPRAVLTHEHEHEHVHSRDPIKACAWCCPKAPRPLT